MRLREAREILGVICTDPFELEIKTRFRELAAQHHPDHGGDPAMFDQVRKAYDCLMAYARRTRKCTVCSGTGKVYLTRGFARVAVRCSACNGKGVQR